MTAANARAGPAAETNRHAESVEPARGGQNGEGDPEGFSACAPVGSGLNRPRSPGKTSSANPHSAAFLHPGLMQHTLVLNYSSLSSE